MPTKFVDALDVINLVEGYTVGPTTSHATLSLVNGSVFDFSLSGNGSNSGVNSASCSALATYQKTGDFNFQSDPPIPINAVITKVTTHAEGAVSGDIQCTTSIPGTCEVFANSIESFPLITGSSTDASNAHFVSSQSVNGDSVIVYDPPIPYTQLVSDYHITLQAIINISALGSGGGGNYSITAVYSAAFSDYSLTVEWEENPFVLQYPDNPIKTGDILTVTGPISPNPTMTMQYGPGPTIVPLTVTVFNGVATFPVPDLTVDTPVEVFFFYGSIPLGSLITIYFTDGTGIYQFIPGQAFDIIYNQSDPPNTINVKIPNPFGKTGFIGG